MNHHDSACYKARTHALVRSSPAWSLGEPRLRFDAALLAVVVLMAVPIGCGDDDGGGLDRDVVARELQACLRSGGEAVEPQSRLAERLPVDVAVLDGDEVTVFIADDGDAAKDAYDAIEPVLAAGADPLDFFVAGQVVVLFSEESSTDQQDLLRDCAREASS